MCSLQIIIMCSLQILKNDMRADWPGSVPLAVWLDFLKTEKDSKKLTSDVKKK